MNTAFRDIARTLGRFAPTSKSQPKAEGERPAETSDEFAIYGDIGFSFWEPGTTAADVRDWLRSRNASARLTVRINSAGGDAFEGVAISNLLRDAPQHVTIKIDGMALSAASIVAMAGNDIHMADNALMMIHDPWTIAMGDASEMRGTADKLDKVADALATTYAGKTGKSVESMREAMRAETWMTAEEAKAAGFIDAVDGSAPPAEEQARASLRERIAAYGYRRAPQNLGTVRASASHHARETTDMTIENKATEELATVKRERDEARARGDKLEAQAKAYEEQNGKLVVERDAALAKAKAYEDQEAERIVDALIGVKFTAAEREHQIKLCKQDRVLFEALTAQRSPMKVLQHDPAGIKPQIPQPMTASANAPSGFVQAVNELPLDD